MTVVGDEKMSRKLIIHKYTGENNQLWRTIRHMEGYVALQNMQSSFYLALPEEYAENPINAVPSADFMAMTYIPPRFRWRFNPIKIGEFAISFYSKDLKTTCVLTAEMGITQNTHVKILPLAKEETELLLQAFFKGNN